MKKYVLAGLALPFWVLAGCAEQPADGEYSVSEGVAAEEAAEAGVETKPGEDLKLTLCGADVVQDLVGGTVEDGASRLPPTARIISPNSVVTQDYKPDRMDVFVSEKGEIERIGCG